MIKIKKYILCMITGLLSLILLLSIMVINVNENEPTHVKSNNQRNLFILAGYDENNRLCEVKKDFDAFDYLCKNKKEERDTNLTYRWFLFDYKTDLIKSSSK